MAPGSAEELLARWLEDRLRPEQFAWLAERLAAGRSGDFRGLAMGFSMASRKLGKGDLNLRGEDRIAADAARPGWNPSLWTIDQSARVLLALSLWQGNSQAFVSQLDRLFAASDVGELVALYQGLCLYPDPPAHRLRAAEGIRTNMRAVFEAVAHRNPYPADELDDGRWNQMVLKSLFVGSTLHLVVGLDRRANVDLARMLWDYARERRAAGRSINPELWRCVGPFTAIDVGDEILDELAIRIKSEVLPERQGVALALAASDSPRARQLLREDPLAIDELANGRWNWPGVADAWQALQGN
jgi:hypothetical protein